jgi:L-rhamnose mutarotase
MIAAVAKTMIFLSLIIVFAFGACSSSDQNKKQEETMTRNYKSNEVDRYCLRLDLKPDNELMKEYKRLHSPEGMWPEIPVGIREAGCLDMEIYLLDNHMTMIVEIPKGEDLDKVWEKMGKLERQPEWAKFMQNFQQPVEGHGDEVKWILMEKVYDLNDYN